MLERFLQRALTIDIERTSPLDEVYNRYFKNLFVSSFSPSGQFSSMNLDVVVGTLVIREIKLIFCFAFKSALMCGTNFPERSSDFALFMTCLRTLSKRRCSFHQDGMFPDRYRLLEALNTFHICLIRFEPVLCSGANIHGRIMNGNESNPMYAHEVQ